MFSAPNIQSQGVQIRQPGTAEAPNGRPSACKSNTFLAIPPRATAAGFYITHISRRSIAARTRSAAAEGQVSRHLRADILQGHLMFEAPCSN